jgi:uncharacterized protein (DUF1778 family)
MDKIMRNRTNRFNMLLTPAEREAWDAASRGQGQTLSEWVRRAARGQIRRDARADEEDRA